MIERTEIAAAFGRLTRAASGLVHVGAAHDLQELANHAERLLDWAQKSELDRLPRGLPTIELTEPLNVSFGIKD